MTGQESIRLDLYNGLQELPGTDRATYLMTHLLPAEMPDLLTKTEFSIEMSQVKTELTGARTDLSELDKRFTKLDDKLDIRFAEVNKRIDRVLLAVVGGLFVVLAAMSGIVAAVINTVS